MTKCTTCGATYPAVQTDGTRYFHACPPLSDAEVATALALPLDPLTWTAKNKSDLAATSRVRPNARNENAPAPATLKATIDALPKTDPAKYWDTVNKLLDTSIVAAGAGVTTVP